MMDTNIRHGKVLPNPRAADKPGNDGIPSFAWNILDNKNTKDILLRKSYICLLEKKK